MNRQRAQSREEAQHAAAVTAFDCHRSGKIPMCTAEVTMVTSFHKAVHWQQKPYLHRLIFQSRLGNCLVSSRVWLKRTKQFGCESTLTLTELWQRGHMCVGQPYRLLPDMFWTLRCCPRLSVMIYYWMVNCQIAGVRVDAVRALREWTLYSELSASSQRNSKRAKVTACELQWSHLSCCSIPAWAPGDHSHLDQWRRSPRSCQSTCRPHKMTRRWLEKAERGRKSAIPPRICTTSLFMNFISCAAHAGLHVFRVDAQKQADKSRFSAGVWWVCWRGCYLWRAGLCCYCNNDCLEPILMKF